MQRRGTIDAALERLVDRPLREIDPPVLAGLRLGIYELLFADGTPDHAAVDQAVELVKRAGAPHASGFVNAVLRRAGREREPLVEALLSDDSTPEAAAVKHSAPLWLAQMWWQRARPRGRPLPARRLQRAARDCLPRQHPAHRRRVRARPPPRRRRQPTASGAPYAAMDHIKRTGSEWPLAAPEMIVVEGQTGDLVPELIAAGELTPQSRGSAAVVEVLDPQPGEHVLDLCAGPGIKTGQIAARMGDRGEVISVENDPERAAEVAAQATSPRPAQRHRDRGRRHRGRDGTGFDRVLLDAPCSDLGALASRPDARWRKSPATIERLVEVQAELLQRALEALRPGGTLVYSTCTISKRENEEHLDAEQQHSAAPRPRSHHRLLHRPHEAR